MYKRQELKKFAKEYTNATDEQIEEAVKLGSDISANLAKDAAEALEKKVAEKIKDLDAKEYLSEILSTIKEVDTEDMSIWTAKSNLLSLANKLEAECKKDLKFKKDLIKLRKAWDKKTGEYDLSGMKDKEGNDASQATKDATAAILRTLNMFGPLITGYRMALSKVYSAVASNLQGALADMAKVIAKGTNIGA